MKRLGWCFLATVILASGMATASLPSEIKNAAPLEAVEVFVMPTLSNEALQKAAPETNTGPFRFAEPIEMSIDHRSAGTWEVLGDGSLLWRARIFSSEAQNLNVGFNPYVMPAGGELYLSSPDRKQVYGPFTDADNEGHGQLWTPIVDGEELVIEVNLPADAVKGLQLQVAQVAHGFRTPAQAMGLRSGSCNVDVICSEGDGWRDQISAVGAYTISGIDTCSGSAVNNTSMDRTPYFLTANHCGISTSNASSIVVYWNYENSTCRPVGSAASGGAGNGSRAQFNSGAIFRAAHSPSDFCLFELDDPIPDAFDIYRAGWDITNTAPTSAVGIHHPQVEEKRISFEYDQTTITEYLNENPNPSSTHIKVSDWNLGTTEGGSSGSPLFNPDKRIVGVLTGGYAACGNDDPDWYGRLYVAWEGGGTSASRLKDWLDPTSSGATAIDGLGKNSLRSGGSPVVDDSAGDGDGVAERGEQLIAVALPIQNSGSGTITNITAVLSSNSPEVSVDQSNSSYTDLTASATASNSTPFVISIGEGHSCGENVSLALDITSDQETVRLNFEIPTGPTCDILPWMVVDSVSLDDSLGNGNGVAEPGEILRLAVTLQNQEGAATDVHAVLATADPGITIVLGNVTYPNLGHGESATASVPFRLHLDASRPCGDQIDFTLDVTSAEGANQQAFSLVHPSLTVFEEDFESGFGSWTTSVGAGTNRWAIRTSSAAISGTQVVSFSPPQALVEDVRLIAGPFTGAEKVEFSHRYGFESGFDGGILEISTNGGGNWTQLNAQITTGGYSGSISTIYGSPIAGRQAWTGGQSSMAPVAVDLSATSAQTILLAWRWASDGSVASSSAWEIDDVLIFGAVGCEPVTTTLEVNGWMLYQ